MSAVPALSEVPSLRDEIDRKAFEQLERLAKQLEDGRITPAMFDAGVNSVWNCVSGLASEAVIHTISEVKDMWCQSDQKDRRFFVTLNTESRQWETLILTRDLSGDKMGLRSIPPGRKTDWTFSECANPSRASLDKQDQVAAMLVGRGFRQI